MLLAACLFSAASWASAQVRVTGTVVSAEDGQPVVGASVIVPGTKVGVVTDINGKFTLQVPEGHKNIRVSSIGMEPQEIAAKENVKITLQGNAKALDEVMVVAYGQQKKSAFTGSAGVISSDKLEERVVSNVTNALAGQVAGVQGISTNGQPGESATIRIRGVGSMSSSNDPLYVVDGVPFDGDIASINPSDIASMTVLKDAASNAIYGARGANGVILITTKQGKTKDAQVTFDAKWGSNSRAIPNYDVITDPGEYYETMFKALYNSQAYAGASAADAYAYANKTLFDAKNGGLGYQVYTVPKGENLIGTNFKLNPNAKLGYSDGTYYYTPDNWYDEIFGNSFRQEYNASVSGRSEKINYYASVGYLNDTGLIQNSAFKRYTGRANIDYQAKKWLKIGTNMSYAYTDMQAPDTQTSDDWGSSGNLFFIVNSIAPIYPMYVRNTDGSIKIDPNTGYKIYDAGSTTNFSRPSFSGSAPRDIEYNRNHTYSDVFNGKWYAQITPVTGLTLTANIAAGVQNSRHNDYSSAFGASVSTDGAVYVSNERIFTVNNQYLANYSHTFANVHNVDVLAGYEQYRLKDQVLYGQNDHMYDPFIGELGNAVGADNKILNSYTDNYMTEGILSRVQYNYDNKYFLSASYRRDASSRFAKEHRWGNFGSVGAAWLLSKENFMQGISWVDMLKFKISWGKQGNDHLLRVYNGKPMENYYAYKDQYTPSYSNGNYSLVLNYKGNKDLTWESSYSFNTGFDFELFKGRLNGTIEYFSRKTTDLLYNKPVPISSGISTGSVPENIGSIMNRGVELDLNGVLVDTHDFKWSLNFNLTHYKNTIQSLSPELEAQGGQKGSYYIYRIGGSLYESYLKQFAGVDPDTGLALYYVDPDNGDYTTTSDYASAKQADMGDNLPKVYGGFGTTLNFFGFDFSAMFSYQLGGQYYDGTYQSFMHNGNGGMQGTNWSKDIRNAWTPENRDTNVPRLDAAINSYQIDSSRFLVSSDYLSINNITLGYTVPKTLLKTLGIAALRVYVTADNLAVISARKGLDPRQSMGLGSSTYGSGASQSAYSPMRTIAGGITLTF